MYLDAKFHQYKTKFSGLAAKTSKQTDRQSYLRIDNTRRDILHRNLILNILRHVKGVEKLYLKLLAALLRGRLQTTVSYLCFVAT